MLRTPWTNGFGSYVAFRVLNSGSREKQRSKVRSGKKLGTESEWGKVSSWFPPPQNEVLTKEARKHHDQILR